MSDSESSDFWNLSKQVQVQTNSESSDFWNLNKKNYKKYHSEDFLSDAELSESDAELSESDAELSESDAELSESDAELSESDAELSESDAELSKNRQRTNSDLTSVKVKSPSELPSKKTIIEGKKISEYTFKEFYQNFMKNVIGITKELKEGKGITTILSNKDRLLHFGIVLIIISILLVPLTLN